MKIHQDFFWFPFCKFIKPFNEDVKNSQFSTFAGSEDLINSQLSLTHNIFSNNSRASIPSLVSVFDTSTVIRITDQNTTAISNIDERPPTVTAITPHVPRTDDVIVPSAPAGMPAYSQIIFNVSGEQSWHFKDHVRLVIIAVHKISLSPSSPYFELDSDEMIHSIYICSRGST